MGVTHMKKSGWSFVATLFLSVPLLCSCGGGDAKENHGSGTLEDPYDLLGAIEYAKNNPYSATAPSVYVKAFVCESPSFDRSSPNDFERYPHWLRLAQDETRVRWSGDWSASALETYEKNAARLPDDKANSWVGFSFVVSGHPRTALTSYVIDEGEVISFGRKKETDQYDVDTSTDDYYFEINRGRSFHVNDAGTFQGQDVTWQSDESKRLSTSLTMRGANIDVAAWLASDGVTLKVDYQKYEAGGLVPYHAELTRQNASPLVTGSWSGTAYSVEEEESATPKEDPLTLSFAADVRVKENVALDVSGLPLVYGENFLVFPAPVRKIRFRLEATWDESSLALVAVPNPSLNLYGDKFYYFFDPEYCTVPPVYADFDKGYAEVRFDEPVTFLPYACMQHFNATTLREATEGNWREVQYLTEINSHVVNPNYIGFEFSA